MWNVTARIATTFGSYTFVTFSNTIIDPADERSASTGGSAKAVADSVVKSGSCTGVGAA